MVSSTSKIKKSVSFYKSKTKIGLANMLYVARRYDESKKLLLTVIRINPILPDVWIMMGMIQEELSDHKRAVGFFLIAALIKPKDLSLWHIIAVKTFRNFMYPEAIECYRQIIFKNKRNFKTKLERALLFWETGCRGLAISVAQQINLEKCKNPHFNLNLAKTISKWYYNIGKYEKAAQTLFNAFSKYKQICDEDILNVMVEILMKKSLFQEAYDMLMTSNYLTTEHNKFCKNFFNLNLNFKICSVRQGYCQEENQCLNLHDYNLEEFGYLSIDYVHNYFMRVPNHKSLDYLKPLIGSPKWDHPAIFARIAKCQKILGDTQLLQEAYHISIIPKKVETAKSKDAVYELSGMYKSLGWLYIIEMLISILKKENFILSSITFRYVELNGDDYNYILNKLQNFACDKKFFFTGFKITHCVVFYGKNQTTLGDKRKLNMITNHYLQNKHKLSRTMLNELRLANHLPYFLDKKN
jgi:tetratricopeptide (TPR) repeat protein